MKTKFIAILLLCSFLLAACGGGEQEAPTPIPATATAEPTPLPSLTQDELQEKWTPLLASAALAYGACDTVASTAAAVDAGTANGMEAMGMMMGLNAIMGGISEGIATWEPTADQADFKTEISTDITDVTNLLNQWTMEEKISAAEAAAALTPICTRIEGDVEEVVAAAEANGLNEESMSEVLDEITTAFDEMAGSNDGGGSGMTAMPVNIVSQGFFQDDSIINIGFLVQNPDMENGVTDLEYQIVAYNADDVVLETTSGYIYLIHAGEEIGFADTIYMDNEGAVSRVEIQLSEGTVAMDPPTSVNPFATSNTTYYADSYYPVVTGLVNSSMSSMVTDIELNALGFDADGNIVGSGYTFLDFIPANGQAAASLGLDSSEAPARVEFYPTFSSFSGMENEANETVSISQFGFGQSGSEVAVGFVIENSDSSMMRENILYRVTIFDAAGKVLEADTGYLEFLFPGQSLGIASSSYLPEDTVASSVDVQVFSRYSAEPGSVDPASFTASDVNYLADEYYPEVTGLINNSLSGQVSDLEVGALVYDAAGNIIGGGYTYLDFIPANGSAAVSIGVTFTGEPASFAIFPQISSITEFGE